MRTIRQSQLRNHAKEFSSKLFFSVFLQGRIDILHLGANRVMKAYNTYEFNILGVLRVAL